jgi:hypothetical protein
VAVYQPSQAYLISMQLFEEQAAKEESQDSHEEGSFWADLKKPIG